MTHRDILRIDKRLAIKFKKITQVIAEIDTSSGEVTKAKIDNMNKGGYLEISDSLVKVYDLISETQMRELFTGHILNIDFASNGQILEINGVSKSWLDGSNVNFKVLQGIRTIGIHQISDSDNYYVDIEPSKKEPKFKSNFLLSSIQLFAPIKR